MEQPARHRSQQEIPPASPTLAPLAAPFGSQLAVQNKRKEKARIAARARRSQEANIIMEMANELHITQEKIRRIDKATIVKLAIDYIKAFEILCRLRGSSTSSSGYEEPQSTSATTITSQHTDSSSSRSSADHTSLVEATNTCSCCCCYDSAARSSHNDASSCSNSTTDSTRLAYLELEGRAQVCTRPTDIELPRERREEARQTLKQFQPPVPSVQASYSAPKLNTGSIFAPKTQDMDSHFLMINERNGRSALILKPDAEILDEDDLTHLAPQAGDVSISLEAEPLDGIELDTSLFASGSPPTKRPAPLLIDSCYNIGTVD